VGSEVWGADDSGGIWGTGYLDGGSGFEGGFAGGGICVLVLHWWIFDFGWGGFDRDFIGEWGDGFGGGGVVDLAPPGGAGLGGFDVAGGGGIGVVFGVRISHRGK